MSRTVMIQCAVCGVGVERRSNRQEYCAECVRELRRDSDRRRRAGERAQRTCLECGQGGMGRYQRVHADCAQWRVRRRGRESADRRQEHRRQRARGYYERRREEFLEYARDYRKANPTAIKARSRRYAQSMRERFPGDPALRGQPWSVGEDAIALDDTLSSAEVADLTGRGWRAVQSRREYLKKKSAAHCK